MRVAHSIRKLGLLMLAVGAPVLRLDAAGFTTDNAGQLHRVAWNDSHVVGSPDPPLPYRAARVYPDLELFQPVYVRAEPGTDRMFLVDHKGYWAGPGGMRVFDDRPDVKTSEPLLQLDRLIYGFCFHPKYRENGYFYVISNGPVKATNKQNRISRFTIDRRPPHMLLADSELIVLEWDSNGHSGGDLAFGPDGYLYCPTGDGTSDSDTLNTGQGLDDLLATMIRIDVDHPDGDRNYSIPDDNPFIHTLGARPEIWAYGFRNPWRMDYDHRQNQLWVGQNGQDLWEQVYLVRKGENYGWSVQEGSHPFCPQRKRDDSPITPPTAEHSHSESRSLTGGVVYWGDNLPELQGAFIYGDFSTGKIWAIKHDGKRVTYHREIADTSLQIVGFATNRAGELLVVDHGGGIYRLEPSPPGADPARFPRKLSETGLFASVPGHVMHPGLIPYSVNVQLWSDGAHKERWMAVPGDEQIEYRPTRGWTFSNGSVLVKSFALEREAGRPETRRWIETRLMVRQQGEWVGYTYRWNDAQTEAELVDGRGLDEEFEIRDANADGGIRRQQWHYPSRAECMVCHSRAANYVLGLTEYQMNRDHDYGTLATNQIDLLDQLGMFQKPPQTADKRGKLTDPFDTHADLGQRALSYLHANCSYCHVGGGGGNAAFEAEINAKPERARMIDERPMHTNFGIDGAKIVASGQPDKSLLLLRMMRRGHGQMPPLATSLVDQPAVDVMRQWIASLGPKQNRSDSAAGAAEARPNASPARPRIEFNRIVAHFTDYAKPEYLPFIDAAQPQVAQVGFYGAHFWGLGHTPQYKGYPAHLPVQGLKECGDWFENLNRELHRRNVLAVGHFNLKFLVGELDGPEGPRGFFKFYRDLWDERELGPKPVADPVDLLEKTVDGEPIVSHKYSIGKMSEYWGCLNNPHWLSVLKAWAKRGIERGIDGYMINYFYRHDCHCEHCVREFKKYLAKRFKPAELREKFAIDDLPAHRFSEIVAWHDPKESTPLRREMLRFSQIANKRAFDEVFVGYARSLKPDLLLAQWDHLGDFNQINGDERCMLPAEDWGRDEDYLWYSSGASAVYTDLKEGFLGDLTLQCRYIRAAFDDKPFTLGKYESTRIRAAIAELAANGGAPMGFYTNFTVPAARDEIVRYYSFLRRYDALYHANRPHAEVVLLFPRTAVHQGDLAPLETFKDWGRRLLDDHVLFDVVPDDISHKFNIRGYRHALHPATDAPPRLADDKALSRFDAPQSVRVAVSVPEVGDEWTVHLVNYNREEPAKPRSPGKGIVDEKPLAVAGIRADMLLPTGARVMKLEFMTPESPDPRPLLIEPAPLGRLKFTVPEFLVYGVVRVRFETAEPKP